SADRSPGWVRFPRQTQRPAGLAACAIVPCHRDHTPTDRMSRSKRKPVVHRWRVSRRRGCQAHDSVQSFPPALVDATGSFRRADRYTASRLCSYRKRSKKYDRPRCTVTSFPTRTRFSTKHSMKVRNGRAARHRQRRRNCSGRGTGANKKRPRDGQPPSKREQPTEPRFATKSSSALILEIAAIKPLASATVKSGV